jgi:hypothetical protein
MKKFPKRNPGSFDHEQFIVVIPLFEYGLWIFNQPIPNMVTFFMIPSCRGDGAKSNTALWVIA